MITRLLGGKTLKIGESILSKLDLKFLACRINMLSQLRMGLKPVLGRRVDADSPKSVNGVYGSRVSRFGLLQLERSLNESLGITENLISKGLALRIFEQLSEKSAILELDHALFEESPAFLRVTIYIFDQWFPERTVVGAPKLLLKIEDFVYKVLHERRRSWR